MSLINQYLKTMGAENADRESVEPVPALLKGRRTSEPSKGRYVQVALLIAIPALIVGVMAGRYTQQRPADVPDKESSRPPLPIPDRAEVAVPAMEFSKPLLPAPANSTVNTATAPAVTALAVTALAVTAPAVTAAVAVTPMPLQPLMSSNFRMEPAAAPTAPRVKQVSETKRLLAKLRQSVIDSENLTRPEKQVSLLKPESAPMVTTPVVTTLKIPKVTRLKKKGDPPKSTRNTQNFYQLGLIAMQEGKLVTAADYFQELLKDNPNHVNALLNLSNVYIRQDQLDPAEQMLNKIVGIDPNHSKPLVNLGFIALRRNDNEAARRFFNAAINVNPVDEIALANLAYLSQMENNVLEAQRYYAKILSINPENVDVLINTAHLFAQEGNTGQAIRLYKRCLGVDRVRNDRGLSEQIENRIKLMRAYE
ncbi:MAG: tetratricopeptide repeat protein [Deltaproteobacteria bacterium]|nr:tetratricopeptide repeat protein [Deltaproteobacteria bacterium]